MQAYIIDMNFYETDTNVLYLCLISIIDDCMRFLMFWLIVHSYSDSDSDSDRNIRYICLDQYWVSVLSVHTIF